ncbi:MAG TPA: hypothetical protein VFZ60_01785 [Nitrososphaeraceae archaeon]|jgi:hypothetical protein
MTKRISLLSIPTTFLTWVIGHKVHMSTLTAYYENWYRAPDIYIIDYRLPGNTNGVEVVIEILKKFPLA